MYSAVILELMCEENIYTGLGDVMRYAFAPLALALVAQVSFAQYLRLGVNEVQGDLAEDCFETSLWMRCVAVYTFVGLCFGHVMQVVDMLHSLVMLANLSQRASPGN